MTELQQPLPWGRAAVNLQLSHPQVLALVRAESTGEAPKQGTVHEDPYLSLMSWGGGSLARAAPIYWPRGCWGLEVDPSFGCQFHKVRPGVPIIRVSSGPAQPGTQETLDNACEAGWLGREWPHSPVWSSKRRPGRALGARRLLCRVGGAAAASGHNVGGARSGSAT